MKLMISLWSEDQLTDLFTNIPSLGHQKPLYPAVFGPWKHRRAYTVTPFTNPDRHQIESESIEKFFDENAWRAFELYLADPSKSDNPL